MGEETELIYGDLLFNSYNLEPCQRGQMYVLSSGDLDMSIDNPNLGFSEEGEL